MKILSNENVAALLPMHEAIDVVEAAMKDVSAGTATLPLRNMIPVGGNNKMGIMPGAISNPACFGVKLVSLFPGNPARGLSSHRGAMVLFEAETGGAIAMMDASLLTAIRTAAASGVATRALAREDSRVLTILGNGEQAEHHLDAICAVRDITTLHIAGRNLAHLKAFAKQAKAKYPVLDIAFGTDIKAAVEKADILCTTTASATPILSGDWLAPGTHLNVVGSSIPSMRELDDATVLRSRIWVDYMTSTLAQAGEIVDMIAAGTITRDHMVGEIGACLSGQIMGRQSADEITLYRSLGVAAQDLSTAHFITERARELHIGQDAEF